MGLLDNTPEAAAHRRILAQGLLSARGMKGLSKGLLGIQEYDDQAKQRQLKEQLTMAQLDEYQAQAAHRQAQADQLKQQQEAMRRKQAALPTLFGMGPQPAMAFNAETNAARASVARPGIDVQRALAAGYSPEEIQKLDSLRNIGQDEVARTVETIQNGRPVTMQFDKFGRPVGSALEQWKAPVEVRRGDRVDFVDPVSMGTRGSFGVNLSPDALLSAQTARRGQDMTDARAKQANDINREAQRTQIINDPNLGPLLIDKGTGQARPAMGMDGKPVPSENQVKKVQGAKGVLSILDQADQLLDKATGSYVGAGADQAMRLVGKSTEGADAIAQLRVLEGGLMMAQPRMEGPQSNMDQQLYRQMAGMIGDPTVPTSQKKAALGEIRRLNQKYVGGQQTQQGPADFSGFKILGVK